MVSTCCVPNCYAFQLEDRTLKFHRFPRSPIRKRRWIEAIFKDTDFDPLNSSLVCEKHFRQFDYIPSVNGTKILSGLAIPSVFREKNTPKKKDGNCDVVMPTFENLTSTEDEKIITKYNFQEICRCCVSNKGEVNVFEVQSHNSFFADLIYFCTNEKILSCDGLPSLICQVCKEQILKSFEFINKVRNNQAHIRKFFQIFSLKCQEQSKETNFRNNSNNFNKAFTEEDISSESRASIVLFKQKYKGLTKVYKQLCDVLLQNRLQIQRRTKVKHKKNTILPKDSVKRKIMQHHEIISILPVKHEEDKKIELSIANENINSGCPNSHGEKLLHNNSGIYTVPVEEKINEDNSAQIDLDDIDSQIDSDVQKNNNDQFTIEMESGNEKKVKSSTQCIDCSEVFHTEAGIIRHCRSTGHIMTYRFKCELCSSTFRLRRYYKMHLQRHNESKCICEICGAIIFSNNLRRHLDIHNDKRIHICQICGKTYARKGVLDIHIKTQHSGKDNKSLCFICGKSFGTLSLLNSHLNHKHVEDDLAKKSYQCEMCNRFFISKLSLKFHQKFSHEKNPIWRCGYKKRNKVISTDQSVIIKQQKHKYCTFCLKYVKSSEYKMHMLVHKNMKIFQCKICNKQFGQGCRLKSHMKMHHFQNHTSLNIV
ncbi:hypothetical protein WA026_023293 [Henosepilachna vigintioctopunctata]|uniref:Uncharacterized protein n=1 Tax=Henosepilachna vigintioctopunctata TaxID=420089 RepID=A0AAW1U2J0_9CUCU